MTCIYLLAIDPLLLHIHLAPISHVWNWHHCFEMVRQNQMTCVCQCSLLEIRPCQNLKLCFPRENLNLDMWQLEVEYYQVVVVVVVIVAVIVIVVVMVMMVIVVVMVVVMVVVVVKDPLLPSPV